jgi:hypothetical protein
LPGDVLPTPSTTAPFNWPAATEPWYVVQAASDLNGDTHMGFAVSSSFTGEIYLEDEGE